MLSFKKIFFFFFFVILFLFFVFFPLLSTGAIFALLFCFTLASGAIFVFSLYCILEHQHFLQGSFYTHLVPLLFFISGDLVFVAASQGMLLNCLTLEAREAYIPGSHGTVTIKRQFLADSDPQGTAEIADCFCFMKRTLL